jgi:glycosidase
MLMKKYSIISSIALFAYFIGKAQLIVTTPAFPTENKPVTIIFSADQGDKGLMGYTGDVYAHTGVITDKSTSGSDWKYVKASWETNLPECKLTRIGTDKYQLAFEPSIREYYGVPAGEKILQMAFVFRSFDRSRTGRDTGGKDIFTNVYEEGLTITFIRPAVYPVIINLHDTLIVEVKANQSDSIAIYQDNIMTAKDTGLYLTDTIIGTDYGKYWIRTIASNDTGTVADSFYYVVRKPAKIIELPEGIRDGINYIDTTTVVLSLFAPYKDYAYVIGDFNGWEVDSNYQMHQTPDGKRYWIEINSLIPRKEYIFQYLINGNLRIGDPYADKISDPSNDIYIDEETYPGLISYPVGKTTNIATILQTDQKTYNWQYNNFTPTQPKDLIIYELLVRDFTTKHTFQAIIDTLGYLEKLGINAIELMPVNEFEGNLSWGYNPSFYFAPDKYYGPKENLKKLIDECHRRGIAVIIDMVLNHAYDQCPFVQLYFDGQKPTSQNPWFNVDHNFTNPDAQWGNDFNHESEYTQQLIDSINSYWMSEYKVDGFRFDFTKGFGNNLKGPDDPWGSNYDADRVRLLKRMADEIWKRNADAIVILEHLAVNTEEKELAEYGMLLWGNLNYNYAEAAMGWNESGKSNFAGISYLQRSWTEPHLVGYMESHDEERLMYKCVTWGNSIEGGYNIQDTTTALSRMLLNSVFFLTIPGPKMIWQFGERGYDLSIEYNGRLGVKPPQWEYMTDSRRRYLYNFYSSLIHLRKKYPVFQTNDFTLNVSVSLKSIVLRHAEMNVFIAGNFGIQEGNLTGDFPHTGYWYDYFSGDSINVTEAGYIIALEAGEYHLYTDRRLEKPDIGPPFSGVISKKTEEKITVFPNPAKNFLVLSGLSSIPEYITGNSIQIEIFDMAGLKVFDNIIKQNGNTCLIDVSIFNDGLYMLILKNNLNIISRNRFVLMK